MHLSERRIAKMRLGGYESDGIPSYARRERGIISSIPPLNQKGFTLVEIMIMIVVAIIALLAAIAVPGFMRARRILNDLRIIDSAVDQYAIENNKKTNDPVSVADWTSYVKKGSPLYNTGNSIFGTPYGSQTVDQLPQVSTSDYNVLSDVAGTNERQKARR
jgi:type II secretory pathway pseudopilin PulG